jgi:DnaJ-domain-containing protein 1
MESINAELDVRELMAQLAAAVMVADGRVTEPELCALDRLDDMGLGPLSSAVDRQIDLATRMPLDARRAASGLARLAPRAGEIVFSALAGLAASDGDLSPRELEVLGVVAAGFGLDVPEATALIRSAVASLGRAPVRRVEEVAGTAAEFDRTERGAATGLADEGAISTARVPASEIDRARNVFGLDSGASAADLDAAYAAMVRRYDPATVLELGPEFAVLAVQRLAKVTAAYVAARQAMEVS